jgi:hypothetical protein
VFEGKSGIPYQDWFNHLPFFFMSPTLCPLPGILRVGGVEEGRGTGLWLSQLPFPFPQVAEGVPQPGHCVGLSPALLIAS